MSHIVEATDEYHIALKKNVNLLKHLLLQNREKFKDELIANSFIILLIENSLTNSVIENRDPLQDIKDMNFFIESGAISYIKNGYLSDVKKRIK